MSDIGGYASLGLDVNKKHTEQVPETKQGVVSDKLPELTLEMPDSDIVKLTDKWEKKWNDSSVKSEFEKYGEENEKYWLGRQVDKLKLDKNRAEVDNLIFESLETYLPQATRRNPEPLIELDNSEKVPQGDEDPIKIKYVEKVKGKLSDLADKNKLRLKLKKATRHWAIYLLGIVKYGWDLDKDIPIVRVIRPKRIILDPDATMDEDGYTGEWVGEYRKLSASRILGIMGDEATQEAKDKIDEIVKKDTGTIINFQEWWTNEYMCWKLGKTILLKKKNPHWNYNRMGQQQEVDNYGNEIENQSEIEGINHFPIPKMPYSFLSVFNLGNQPVDNTSLIGQNLANQDLINKRNQQIDKNADRMNGGMVVSLARSGLTQPQAKAITEALRKGGVVTIPDGTPREAIDDYAPSGLPADVYNQLQDTRARLRDVFGIKGSSQAGLNDEKTVRGKILSRGLDTDRIGGGVTEYLEQFADDIYNWFLQLEYVYDTAFQFVEGAIPPKLIISVKEGSLLPKDSLTIANQAIELASLGRLANIDLFKRLEYPNPEELAANVWLEVNAPELLYKDNQMVQQAIMMRQQAAQQQAQMEMMGKEQELGQKQEGEIGKEVLKNEMAMERDSNKADLLKKVPVK